MARGVLLDVPRVRGTDRLAAGDRVTEADPKACGVQMRAGDVAVVRTGWPPAWRELPETYWSGQPGLSAGAGLAGGARRRHGRLRQRGDRRTERARPRRRELDDDLHLILLWRHGIRLAETLWLEELAATGRTDAWCCRSRIWRRSRPYRLAWPAGRVGVAGDRHLPHQALAW